MNQRFGIKLIQEASSILFGEYSGKSPRLVLERLNILNLDKQNVSRLGRVDIERSGQVVNFGQINRSNILGRVVILDLSACPVQTFDLDDFIVGNFATCRN